MRKLFTAFVVVSVLMMATSAFAARYIRDLSPFGVRGICIDTFAPRDCSVGWAFNGTSPDDATGVSIRWNTDTAGNKVFAYGGSTNATESHDATRFGTKVYNAIK